MILFGGAPPYCDRQRIVSGIYTPPFSSGPYCPAALTGRCEFFPLIGRDRRNSSFLVITQPSTPVKETSSSSAGVKDLPCSRWKIPRGSGVTQLRSPQPPPVGVLIPTGVPWRICGTALTWLPAVTILGCVSGTSSPQRLLRY